MSNLSPGYIYEVDPTGQISAIPELMKTKGFYHYRSHRHAVAKAEELAEAYQESCCRLTPHPHRFTYWVLDADHGWVTVAEAAYRYFSDLTMTEAVAIVPPLSREVQTAGKGGR